MALQGDRWIEVMDIELAVAGKNYGKEVYQAQRVANSLQQSDPASTSLLRLNMHVTQIQTAMKLSPDSADKLAVQERRSNLEELWPQLRSHPPLFCSGLVKARVKDVVKPLLADRTAQLDEDSVEAWLDAIKPFRDAGGLVLSTTYFE
eukprot:5799203-Amphidinium_carterae.2